MKQNNLQLENRLNIIAAHAILKNREKVRLIQKPDYKTNGLSQCLFFEGITENGLRIQPRLDFTDIDEENGDPKLDIEVFSFRNGRKRKEKIDRNLHHTSKKFDGEWLYKWPGSPERGISPIKFRFKTTNQQTISGRSKIIK